MYLRTWATPFDQTSHQISSSKEVEETPNGMNNEGRHSCPYSTLMPPMLHNAVTPFSAPKSYDSESQSPPNEFSYHHHQK